jgi:hypothetical protein
VKIKLIKKADRDIPLPAAEAEAEPDPKEWSSAVKSWVKDFQADRKDATVAAFDSLFDNSPR